MAEHQKELEMYKQALHQIKAFASIEDKHLKDPQFGRVYATISRLLDGDIQKLKSEISINTKILKIAKKEKTEKDYNNG